MAAMRWSAVFGSFSQCAKTRSRPKVVDRVMRPRVTLPRISYDETLRTLSAGHAIDLIQTVCANMRA